MPRKSSFFTMRKPRLRISPTGIRITKPSVRIGRQVGLNISSRGMSVSARTPMGTINSRSGCSCPLFVLAFMAFPVGAAVLLWKRI